MNELTDTQKTLLAMFKNRDPERYRIKLEQYGVQESDILDSIHKEQERRLALKLVERATFTKPKSSESVVGHEYYMGGKPYWSREPLSKPTHSNEIRQVSAKISAARARNVAEPVLVLVDGDNHVYEALKGIDKIRRKFDIEVYVTDNNLKIKLKEKYGLDAKIVKRGPQAVDNRIKGIAGDQAKKHKYKKIAIISHDKGYEEKIKEWISKYEYKSGQIKRVESIRQALG